MKNPMEALHLSERKLGRKICIGLLIPIAIMLLNLLCYLIWREEDVSVLLSLLSMGFCYCVVCCIQVHYASLLTVLCEAASTGILYLLETVICDLFPSNAFGYMRFFFFLSMGVFLLAQFVVLAIFAAVRYGIRRHRDRRNPEQTGETA